MTLIPHSPAPMPRDITYDAELVSALSDADRAVGILNGRVSMIKEWEPFLLPFICAECVASSRIEGINVTYPALLAKEAGMEIESDPDDLQEAINCVEALRYGWNKVAHNDLPLCLRLIRDVHERLMQGERGKRALPGQFRRSQNLIGGFGPDGPVVKYVPPAPEAVMPLISQWERSAHDDFHTPLVLAGLLHAQFEIIHPFLDGNGRTGRHAITLFLTDKDILRPPFLALSPYFERTRPEYYARLHAVTEAGTWESWLKYFLKGVAEQSEDALSKIESLRSMQRRLGISPDRDRNHLMLRFIHRPIRSLLGLSSELGLSEGDTRKLIAGLEEIGALLPFGSTEKFFYAPEVLDLFSPETTEDNDSFLVL